MSEPELTSKEELPRTAAPKKPKNVAADMLRSSIVARAKRKQAERDDENEKNVFFLQCPRLPYNPETGEGHVAAWLTEKPVGALVHAGMWYSLFHEVGAPWMQTIIPCQECYAEGEERSWPAHMRPVRREDGSFDFAFSADRKLVIGSMPRENVSAKVTTLKNAAGQEVR